jgi:hypothetical protein
MVVSFDPHIGAGIGVLLNPDSACAQACAEKMMGGFGERMDPT